MSSGSAIEWTDATWNPTTGCDRVSPGCDNCYALTLAGRLKAMGQPKYQRDGDPKTSGPGFALSIHSSALHLPLRWRKPRMVFVNSMSDLFHGDVPERFTAEVFAVMSLAPQHTFQILTKRHARMRSLLTSWRFWGAVNSARLVRGHPPMPGGPTYALANVWLGVSAEDQRHAHMRLGALSATPAAVRILSAEPLLGPITLGSYRSALDWVIVGGESGPNARPVDADWVRALRDECDEDGTAFFFKQWGGRTPKSGGRELDGRTWDQYPRRLEAAT